MAPIPQIQPELFLSELRSNYRGDEGPEVFSTAWNTLMVTVSSWEAPGGLCGGVEHPQDLLTVTLNAGERLVHPRQTPSCMLSCSPSLHHLPTRCPPYFDSVLMAFPFCFSSLVVAF